MKRIRLKLGDIFEIPLPNGWNAYGRLFKGDNLAIYKERGKSFTEISDKEEYEFFVFPCYGILEFEEWKRVGNRKFAKEEDACPPPKCKVSDVHVNWNIYYDGKTIPCTYEECKDLEIMHTWDKEEVVERLMGDTSWKERVGRPRRPDESVQEWRESVWPKTYKRGTENKNEEKPYEQKNDATEYVTIIKDEEVIRVSFLIEHDQVMEVGEQMEQLCEEAYMNGYNWEVFLQYYFEKKAPNLLEDLETDPEAGMYVAMYPYSEENEKKAKQLSEFICSIIENPEEVYLIVEENGNEIEWD